MPTFRELQTRLSEAQFYLAVIHHLVEHIDSNFRPGPGTMAKSVLLTDDKVAVPTEIFEAVVGDVLMNRAAKIEAEIAEILATNLQSAPTVATPSNLSAEERSSEDSEREEALPPPPAQAVFVAGLQQPFQAPPAPVLPILETRDAPTTRKRRQSS